MKNSTKLKCEINNYERKYPLLKSVISISFQQIIWGIFKRILLSFLSTIFIIYCVLSSKGYSFFSMLPYLLGESIENRGNFAGKPFYEEDVSTYRYLSISLIIVLSVFLIILYIRSLKQKNAKKEDCLNTIPPDIIDEYKRLRSEYENAKLIEHEIKREEKEKRRAEEEEKRKKEEDKLKEEEARRDARWVAYRAKGQAGRNPCDSCPWLDKAWGICSNPDKCTKV